MTATTNTRARGRPLRSAGRRMLVAVTTVLAAAACALPNATAGSATSVPLEFEPGPNRLVADVEVGGAELRVLVDTGSTGLRVVADEVPPEAVTPTGPAARQSYGSGVAITGTVARAPVRLGPLTGTAPVELVTGTSCVTGRPTCQAAGGRAPDSFGGEYDGILGIGVAGSPDVPNPLWYLGRHVFTVHHDPDGSSELALGTPATGFRLTQLEAVDNRLPDGPPAWQPRVPVCFAAAPLPGGRTCSPSLLDTGNPGFALVNDPRLGPGTRPLGTPVSAGPPEGGWSADSAAVDRVWIGQPPTGNPGSVVGLSAFARLDVRFDLDHGTVGVRSRWAPVGQVSRPASRW